MESRLVLEKKKTLLVFPSSITIKKTNLIHLSLIHKLRTKHKLKEKKKENVRPDLLRAQIKMRGCFLAKLSCII